MFKRERHVTSVQITYCLRHSRSSTSWDATRPGEGSQESQQHYRKFVYSLLDCVKIISHWLIRL